MGSRLNRGVLLIGLTVMIIEQKKEKVYGESDSDFNFDNSGDHNPDVEGCPAFARISVQGHLVVVSKTYRLPTSSKIAERKQVKEFSASSATRLRRYLRMAVAEYENMLTLTYSYDETGQRSKDHLRRFCQELQRYDDRHKRQSVHDSIFWFLEFTKTGRIHYHLFLTQRYPKEWIAKTWYEVVGSDDIRHLYAGTRIEKIRGGRRAFCAYASKYAAKHEQKKPPESMEWVGRFWGVYGCRLLKSADLAFKLDLAVNSSLERHRKRIKQVINEGLSSGKVEKYPNKRENVSVYYIKSDSVLAELFRLVKLAEISLAVSACKPNIDFYTFRFPELEDELC